MRNRVGVLDSFRCIAVIMVVMFHYFSGGASLPNYYPFKDKFLNLFKYGYLGVELFFIISGYVIFMTLEKSESRMFFFKKRFIRLFPLLLICSIITYFSQFLIDRNNSFAYIKILHPEAINFFPSLTFSDIWIWNQIFHKKIGYIDNVYWTLAVEVKFYILSAFIYFFNKKRFLYNWLIFANTSMLLFLFFLKTGFYNISQVIGIFIIAKYVGYFSLGIFFYNLSKKEKIENRVLLLTILAFIAQGYQLELVEFLFLLSFLCLFIIFIYKPHFLFFLDNKFFTTIGIVSYPYYLIHCSIGLLLMFKFALLLNLSENAWLLYIFIIPILFLVSYLLHFYVEKPISLFLRKFFFNK